ncbi:MAG: hypothetical protein Q8O92_11895 [Candidatus Latescibacter sp.]|nr:hypothetical protein [Candidatus Latescibacter sp.]
MKKTVFIFMVFSFLLMVSLNRGGIVKSWSQEHKEMIMLNGKEIDPSKIPDEKPEGMSEEEWWKLKAKKPLPFDKGPSTIDVSKYPKNMQDIYTNTYVPKCSKCHTIARAINAPYALPDEWMNYIKKMMKKPGSGLNPAAAKDIYQYCVYDSQVRKKDLLEKKLKEKEQGVKQ